MKSDKRQIRISMLENALSKGHMKNEIYECPLCKRRLRGDHMTYHLSSVHGNERRTRNKVARWARKKMERALRLKKEEKIVKRTKEQGERDMWISRKPALEDAKVPHSHIRKIDK